MNRSIRLLGLWSGLGFCISFGIGLGFLAGWIPPTSPSIDAETLARFFREESVSIRIGMVLMVLGTSLYLPFTVMISDLIKQSEGESYFLSGTQLMGGILSMLVLFVPTYNFTLAAFRPERMPEITQVFVDQGWLIFITGLAPFVLQNLAIAFAAFSDKTSNPVFPRWLGYLMLWVSASYLPAVFAFFLKRGPFAWDGLFVWWIPLGMFALWFAGLLFCSWKASGRQTLWDAVPDGG